MGGAGAGHKSEKARRSRLVNIQKARAARKRAPLPWRSGMESRIIEQLVWQWWVTTSGQCTVVSGQGKRQQIPATAGKPHTATMRPVRNDKLGRPWAKYRVARFLGVSHTWVNKLVKRFEADPERMRRKMRAFAPASFEKLERAREETRRERERGWLRGPIRWRRVKVTIQGRKQRVAAPTRAEMKRRAAHLAQSTVTSSSSTTVINLSS